MKINESYDIWSSQYDSNKNKTRDLEKKAFESFLNERTFGHCLELGCGTGKNTMNLVRHCSDIIAVDFSDKMLDVARQKVESKNVKFVRADLNKKWNFTNREVELITFNLVLEHIEELFPVFEKAHSHLQQGGIVYLAELHPFKQYSGSQAQFDTDTGRHTLTCYLHHFSDYWKAANKAGLSIVAVNEFYDEENTNSIPRILNLVLQKQ